MPDDQHVPPFDPAVTDYVYRQVADHVTARIRAGEPRPGSRLPGERELAEEYGVALGTARRAVRELRDRGVAATLPAKGTFVAALADAGDE